MKKILKDRLLIFFGGLMLLLLFFQPVAFSALPTLVHWPTLTALTALLLTTTGIKTSGVLERWAGRFTHLLGTERSIALSLVFFSALSAMILTNVIALFLIIPFTMKLHKKVPLNIRPLLILETIAVNSGSLLTPIGNPQNIYLWQHAQVPFLGFIKAMLPPTLIQLILLVIAIFFMADADPLTPAPLLQKKVDYKLAAVSSLMLTGYLVGNHFGLGLYMLAIIAIVFLVAFRKVVWHTDWALLILFLLLFIDVGLLARFPFLKTIGTSIHKANHLRLIFTAAGLSQFISNVPATLFLSHYTHDWKYLAWGVNIGANGLLVASFANLISVRLARAHKIGLIYHIYALPFLLASGVMVYFWMMLG